MPPSVAQGLAACELRRARSGCDVAITAGSFLSLPSNSNRSHLTLGHLANASHREFRRVIGIDSGRVEALVMTNGRFRGSGARDVTPRPTRSTLPIASWSNRHGYARSGKLPRTMLRSVPQMPHVRIRTRACYSPKRLSSYATCTALTAGQGLANPSQATARITAAAITSACLLFGREPETISPRGR